MPKFNRKGGYTRKAWQANRPGYCKGMGVGKVLDTMASIGLERGDPSSVEGSADFVIEKLIAQIRPLLGALGKAETAIKKHKKDTEALKYIQAFIKDVDGAFKKDLQAELAKAEARKIEADRQRWVTMQRSAVRDVLFDGKKVLGQIEATQKVVKKVSQDLIADMIDCLDQFKTPDADFREKYDAAEKTLKQVEADCRKLVKETVRYNPDIKNFRNALKVKALKNLQKEIEREFKDAVGLTDTMETVQEETQDMFAACTTVLAKFKKAMPKAKATLAKLEKEGS